MAAPTDLTWRQFADALGELIGSQIGPIQMVETPQGKSIVLTVQDFSPFLEFFNNPTQGVIKALSRQLTAARLAQTKINDGKPAGERLAAFPVITVGTITNGQVPISQSITSKADLSSATIISGTTA